MTNPIDVEEDVLNYLNGAGRIVLDGIPLQVIYQNRKIDAKIPLKIPRIVVDRTADITRTIGLSPSGILKTSLVLTIVTSFGSYFNDRNEIYRDIYIKFPIQKEIGAAIVTKFPESRPGYRDGNEYRTPVFIEYTAILKN